MKKITIIASFFITACLVQSCSKNFLDEKPYSSYTPATLQDSLGFEAAITGLYNQLSTFFTYAGPQGWPCVWQVGTDIAYSTPNHQGIEDPYWNYITLTSTDQAASYTWNWAYALINNANLLITGVEDPSYTGMTQAGKDADDAEAKFFRAYAYDILATCYGGVPLVTEPIASPKTDFTRASLDDINNLIVSDLTFAISKLPDIEDVKKNSKGKMYERANKYQAMQLLGQVYLRMDKNDLAEQQLQAVINSGQFHLINARYGVKTGQPGDYFSDMFQYGNERRSQGNTEAIWVLEEENPASVVGGITNNAQQRRCWGAAYHNVQGMVPADSLGGRSLARMRLDSWVLYGLYDAGDIRNSEYNIKRQFYYNNPAFPDLLGKPVPYQGVDTLMNLAPHTTKWGAFDPNDVFGFAMIKDFILMRLGETYLLLAEAQVKQGKLQQAASNINMLRTRAEAPLVTASQMTMDFILDERVRELVGEENRRMTLMRTHTLVERAMAHNAVSPTNSLSGITKNNELMPIPQSEIDLNKDAVLEQNPGY